MAAAAAAAAAQAVARGETAARAPMASTGKRKAAPGDDDEEEEESEESEMEDEADEEVGTREGIAKTTARIRKNKPPPLNKPKDSGAGFLKMKSKIVNGAGGKMLSQDTDSD